MVKGGHLPGNETIDLLHDGDRMIELPGHRIENAQYARHGLHPGRSVLAALLPQSLTQFEVALPGQGLT